MQNPVQLPRGGYGSARRERLRSSWSRWCERTLQQMQELAGIGSIEGIFRHRCKLFGLMLRHQRVGHLIDVAIHHLIHLI